MRQISAGEFRKHSRKYWDMAQKEPITITQHERPAHVLLSFDEYQKLTDGTRRALHVTQLSAEDLDEIAAARMPEEFNHLNEEMD